MQNIDERLTREESAVDVDALLHDLHRLETSPDHAARHENYDRTEAAMGGTYKERKRTGVWERILSSLMPWFSEEAKRAPLLTVNLIPTLLDFKQAWIGVQPSRSVPVKSYADDDVQHSDLIEQMLAAEDRRAVMKRRYGEVGITCPAWGTAAMFADPNIFRKRIDVTVREPRGFYPICRDQDGFEIARCFEVDSYDGLTADVMWPGKGLDSKAIQEVIRYRDEKITCRFTRDGKFLEGRSNKLGFVPGCLVQNKRKPGSLFGDDDISPIIELMQEFNRMRSLRAEFLLKALYAPWVIVNAIKMPKKIPYGPGAAVGVYEGGGMKQAEVSTLGGYAWDKAERDTMELAKFLTDTQDAEMGQMRSDRITASALAGAQAPHAGRIEIRHQDIFPAYERIDAIRLMILEKVFYDEPIQIFGESPRGRYSYTAYPEEIDGYYDVFIYQNSSKFVDITQRIVLGMEMVDRELLSPPGFLDWVGDTVRDRRVELEAINEYALRKAHREAQKFAIMAGAQTMTTPMTGANMGMPGTPPPAQLPAAPAQGEGTERMDTLEGLAAAFREIPGLKGRVWLATAPFEDGSLDDTEILDVFYTEGNDKKRIIDYMTSVVPALTEKSPGFPQGHMNFIKGTPSADVLEVTPSNVEVPGEETLGEEVPEEETEILPPEIAALIGT